MVHDEKYFSARHGNLCVVLRHSSICSCVLRCSAPPASILPLLRVWTLFASHLYRIWSCCFRFFSWFVYHEKQISRLYIIIDSVLLYVCECVCQTRLAKWKMHKNTELNPENELKCTWRRKYREKKREKQKIEKETNSHTAQLFLDFQTEWCDARTLFKRHTKAFSLLDVAETTALYQFRCSLENLNAFFSFVCFFFTVSLCANGKCPILKALLLTCDREMKKNTLRAPSVCRVFLFFARLSCLN